MFPYASEHSFQYGLDDGRKFFIGFSRIGERDVNVMFLGEKIAGNIFCGGYDMDVAKFFSWMN